MAKTPLEFFGFNYSKSDSKLERKFSQIESDEECEGFGCFLNLEGIEPQKITLDCFDYHKTILNQKRQYAEEFNPFKEEDEFNQINYPK
jgi:hypothetical protein